MQISTFSFTELSNQQLYQLLKLRVDVFVVEQACAYAELDNQDQHAIHFLGTENNELVAYARVLEHENTVHLGRIVTPLSVRQKGYGKQMITSALAYCKQHYTNKEVHISAQAQLKAYYEQYGFAQISDEYDWDGILHIDMKLS